MLTTEADTTESDGRLSVGDLVRMFEESEDASLDARKDAERDRDYVDNKQLTAEELDVLAKRGQPPQIDNRIKTKVDYLVGLEKQQRVDPKALPRTPLHEEDADGATQALRYVAETELFDNKRSGVWRNLLVEGCGGISVSVEPDYNGEMCIKLRRIAWDRMFYDPHSSETDFSDASYLGVVVWMDYADALLQYPDRKDELDVTMASVAHTDTYDDKPKFNVWADKKRKRIRICKMWIKRGDEWHFAEFTKGGILKAGPSPYKTDKGESDCELFFQSAYVDRDNNRYGLVREMITLQDGINKRHSKALHLLNTVQVTALDGAVDDVEKARSEVARPDSFLKVNPVAPGGGLEGNIKIETRLDLAAAQLQLLQEAKNSIDLKGPNATAMGDKAQGSAAASGKAIIASQQGGMISLGDLLDNLRHLDRRVFRAVWARIRQFWTAEKWIRITDDERNIKWVGLNVDPMKMQQIQMMAQQNPEAVQNIGGLVSNVAQLDCDIMIDEVPDVIASQEQFANLVELKKFDVNNEIPFRALVVASNIKDKSKMLDEMDKASQGRPDPMEAEKAKIAAEAELQRAKAAADMEMKQAQAAADMEMKQAQTAAELQMERERLAAEIELENQKAEAAMRLERDKADLQAEIENDRTQRELAIQEHRTRHEITMSREKASNDFELASRKGEMDAAKSAEEVKREVSRDVDKLSDVAASLQSAVKDLAADLSADVEIIRDARGRPAGTRRVRRKEYA